MSSSFGGGSADRLRLAVSPASRGPWVPVQGAGYPQVHRPGGLTRGAMACGFVDSPLGVATERRGVYEPDTVVAAAGPLVATAGSFSPSWYGSRLVKTA